MKKVITKMVSILCIVLLITVVYSPFIIPVQTAHAAPPLTSIVDAGTNNTTATIAPGASATDTGRFSASDDKGGGSSITSVTVTFPANVVAGIASVQVFDSTESTGYLSASSPTGDTFVLTTGTAIPSNTTATEFHILVTPKSHGTMPVPNGATYAATAHITACTSTAGSGCTTSDTADNTVTIDNLSPNDASSTSGSVLSSTEIQINWTTSNSSDYERSVVLRWTASTPGSDVPAEGTNYNLDDTIGSATVACVENTGTPSTAYSGVDGSGSDECSTTELTGSTQYSYKHFEKDTNGNWNTGLTNASSPLTTSAGKPSITTTAATGVTVSSAVLNGNTVSLNDGNLTVRGFVYGTDSTLSTVIATTTESGDFGTGTFSQTIETLQSGVTYYFRAYGTNSGGTGFGTILNFTAGTDTTPIRTMRLFEGFTIKLIGNRIVLYGQ